MISNSSGIFKSKEGKEVRNLETRREVKALKRVPLIIVAGLIVLVLAASAVSFAATSAGSQSANNSQTPALNRNAVCSGNCACNCYNGSVERRNFAGKRSAFFAEALGMTVEEFKDLRSQGKTIKEIAESRGLNVEDVIAKVLEKDRQYLDALVRNGQMTQEDAERILEFRKQRLTERASEKPCSPCVGGGGRGFSKGSGACCGR